MSKLVISADQEADIVALEDTLEQAFTYGVEDNLSNPILDPLALYDDPAVQAVKQQVKDPFKSLIAAMMVALNLDHIPPIGLTTTVVLAKLTPSGSTGLLTFESGILVAKVDPS